MKEEISDAIKVVADKDQKGGFVMFVTEDTPSSCYGVLKNAVSVATGQEGYSQIDVDEISKDVSNTGSMKIGEATVEQNYMGKWEVTSLKINEDIKEQYGYKMD